MTREPRFASVPEQSRFWRGADTVAYWDIFRETDESLELAPSLVRTIDQRSTSKRRVSIYLDAWTIRLAHALAEREGVHPHDIFRRWVDEGIRARRSRSP